MLKGFQLVRNIGCFDLFKGSDDTKFAPLTLVYAENGRGKTTIAAILRSLATGMPAPINGRCRLGSSNVPHVVVDIDGEPKPTVFEKGQWSKTYDSILIFDDHFVDDNVYSGLAVDPSHRQNLHEVILGRQGVSLARRVTKLAKQIGDLTIALRGKESAIPKDKMFGLDVGTFCGLKELATVDTDISATERTLDAVKKADRVRITRDFSQLDFPAIDVSSIESLLGKQISDLDEAAVSRVQVQSGLLGEGGEKWIADGVPRIQGDGSPDNEERCPFCDQTVADIDLVDKYRLYFGEAYRSLQTEIASAISDCTRQLGGDALAQFQRALNKLVSQHAFWNALTELPPLDPDPESLVACWGQARDALLTVMRAKQQAPLERLELEHDSRKALTQYVETVGGLKTQIEALVACNTAISEIKKSVESGKQSEVATRLNRLKAAKERHTAAVKPLCDDYLAAKKAKAAAEKQKKQARNALDSHRKQVLPSYREAVNKYLERFRASFRIEGVDPQDAAGKLSTAYHLTIRNTTVPLAIKKDDGDQPSFGNTMSAGDRNTLALSFFFASLDLEDNLDSSTIVIDDPVSSLDDGRAMTTVQEVKRLTHRTKQVLVMSHDKPFLCRIFKHAKTSDVTCLSLARLGQDSSVLEAWDAKEDEFTEYDQRHKVLREFKEGTVPDIRQVAQAIRPIVEGYLRVAFPEFCPPGTLLGHFRQKIQTQIDAGKSVMETDRLLELEELTEYANKFHHDTNAAWETEHINDTELLGFVDRTMTFISH